MVVVVLLAASIHAQRSESESDVVGVGEVMVMMMMMKRGVFSILCVYGCCCFDSLVLMARAEMRTQTRGRRGSVALDGCLAMCGRTHVYCWPIWGGFCIRHGVVLWENETSTHFYLTLRRARSENGEMYLTCAW